MGPDGIADPRTPVVEIGVEMRDGIAANLWPEIQFECAIKAFNFSLSLRVIGPVMDGTDAEPDQLRFEP